MGSIIVCYDLPVIMRVHRIVLALPLILLVLSCTSEPPAPPRDPKELEHAAIANLGEINRAQADFLRRTRRYAQSFNELIAEHLMQAEPPEDSGYKFSLYPSPDAVSFTLLQEQLHAVLDTLSEREAGVVSMRFGLTDGQPKTLDEIGKVYGVTRERIRQIESKTMSKLRHPSRSQVLRDYLD